MRTTIGLVLGLLLALAVAGCGKKPNGDGVATAGGGKNAGPSASATPSLDPQERARKWQQCLADQGIDVNVDSSGGKTNVRISPGPSSDQQKVAAAMEKCKQYAPGGGDTARADPAMQEAMRKFAKCMRDNGVADFPDPSSDGGMMIKSGGAVDPESDSFKAAQRKCQALMPQPSMRATQ